MNFENQAGYSSTSGHMEQNKMQNINRYQFKLPVSERIVFLNLPPDANELLMVICNEAILVDYPLISLTRITKNTNDDAISELKNSDPFTRLLRDRYIELLTPNESSGYDDSEVVHISNFSMDRFFQVFFKDYEIIKKCVIEFVLYRASKHEFDMLKSEVISKMLKQKKLVVNTILEGLEYEGKISLERSHGENWIIKEIKHEMFRNVMSRFT